jgi:hypothetical protein
VSQAPTIVDAIWEHGQSVVIDGVRWWTVGTQWTSCSGASFVLSLQREVERRVRYNPPCGPYVRNPVTGMPINVRAILERWVESMTVKSADGTSWAIEDGNVVLRGAKIENRSAGWET